MPTAKKSSGATKKKSDAPKTDFPKTSGPAESALIAAGYTRMSQLTKVSEMDLLKLHGMGPKAIRILRDALKAQGKSFAPEKKQK